VADPTGPGYEILRGVVPPEGVDRVLRRLHLDIVRNGLGAEDVGRWIWAAHWFPHLKWDDEILSVLEYLPDRLRSGEQCDAQILLQPPDEAEEVELVPHVDAVPDWADGRPYLRIVGVALSPAHERNGGLLVWPFDGEGPVALTLEPGDVVVMDPQLPHTSGLNREGAMRYAVYFRFLRPSH
jgi:hypothetical protein